jgi:hypothetical protein
MLDNLKPMLENISSQVGNYLPGILTAIAVLVIGWIVAKIIAALIGKGLRKSGAGERLSRLVSPDGKVDASRIISKVVFYLLMLFVLITFFNVLNLPVVSEPLNAFLEQIFAYAPRILSAAGLGVVAYVLARVLKEISKRGLEAIDIDTRLSSLGQDASALTSAVGGAVDSAIGADDDLDDDFSIDADDDFSSSPSGQANAGATAGESVQLSQTLPEAVYWIVFALFLPAILGALQMPGLLEPVQQMFTKALSYVPNIIGAAVILAIGLFVGKLVKQVVSNLTASLGVNQLAGKLGVSTSAGKQKPSDLLGVVSYAFILLPIVVAALNALDIEAVTKPAGAILERISSLLPGFIGAAVVLGIAVFVGRLVATLVEDLAEGFGINSVPEKLGLKLSNLNENQSPAKIAGKLVLAAIVLLSLMQALPMMGLDAFAGHVNTFAAFAIRLLIALVMLAAGMYLANLAANQIKASGIENSELLATIAKVAVFFFAGGFALQHLGVSSSLINVAFGSLLGGLGLAIAIAFGWGGRDAAKRVLDRHIK